MQRISLASLAQNKKDALMQKKKVDIKLRFGRVLYVGFKNMEKLVESKSWNEMAKEIHEVYVRNIIIMIILRRDSI